MDLFNREKVRELEQKIDFMKDLLSIYREQVDFYMKKMVEAEAEARRARHR